MEEDFLEQTKGREIDLIVCSDAEQILGIGDQGVGVRITSRVLCMCCHADHASLRRVLAYVKLQVDGATYADHSLQISTAKAAIYTYARRAYSRSRWCSETHPDCLREQILPRS